MTFNKQKLEPYCSAEHQQGGRTIIEDFGLYQEFPIRSRGGKMKPLTTVLGLLELYFNTSLKKLNFLI